MGNYGRVAVRTENLVGGSGEEESRDQAGSVIGGT